MTTVADKPISWEDKEIAVWLLNLANDMRRYKNDNLLNDLPVSVPQDTDNCIIANAFNYGCSVDPDAGIITFTNQGDVDTYFKVMNLDKSEYFFGDEMTSDELENCFGIVLWNCQAPMTDDLIDIALEFDAGHLFKKYTEGYNEDEDGLDY